MATIFNVNPNGVGVGTISEGTDNDTHRENTINYDSYFDNDVKFPGICKQTPVWQTDSTSGYSYSQIGNHVYLRGNINGASGKTNGSTIATLGSALAPTKPKFFLLNLKIDTSSTSSSAWVRVKLDTTGKILMMGATYIDGIDRKTPTSLYGDFDIEYWR